MNIVVCIKQVPILSEIKVDTKKGMVIREGATTVINPEDTNAIAEAIKLRDKFGGTVTAISMGPRAVRISLKEALAMGVDDTIHLRDDSFSGSDAQVTAKVLAKAIKKRGDFDIIICGAQTLDGNTALVGPMLAEYLDIPQVSYVKKIDIKRGMVIAKRFTEASDYIYKCKMPVLLTVTKELNDPHLPTMIGIYDAYGYEDDLVWDANDLEITPETVGEEGSATKVTKVFKPKRSIHIEYIKAKTNWEKADILVEKMIESKLI